MYLVTDVINPFLLLYPYNTNFVRRLTLNNIVDMLIVLKALVYSTSYNVSHIKSILIITLYLAARCRVARILNIRLKLGQL